MCAHYNTYSAHTKRFVMDRQSADIIYKILTQSYIQMKTKQKQNKKAEQRANEKNAKEFQQQ